MSAGGPPLIVHVIYRLDFGGLENGARQPREPAAGRALPARDRLPRRLQPEPSASASGATTSR